MKERIPFWFLLLLPFFWLLIFSFLFSFRARADLASTVEPYTTDILPLVSTLGTIKKEKEFIILQQKFPSLSVYEYRLPNEQHHFFYQVVWKSGSGNVVFWQGWKEKDGTSSAALRRKENGTYTIAHDAYVAIRLGFFSDRNKTVLEVMLLSKSISRNEEPHRKKGDKGVFAVEYFFFDIPLNIQPPEPKTENKKFFV